MGAMPSQLMSGSMTRGIASIKARADSAAAATPGRRAPEPGRHCRYVRAVYGAKDRRFPKRDPVIEAMYPGHLLPDSPQMLEELLRRSLALEQARRRLVLVTVEAADTAALRAAA